MTTLSTPVEPTTAQTSLGPTKPHRFRSLTGCFTCRRRKKKCDEKKPKCVACSRNKLQCAWPAANPRRIAQNLEHRAVSQDRDSTSAQLDPPARWSNPTGSFVFPKRASMFTETSSLLFTHYLTKTANLLSTSAHGRNPFLTLIVPLCCNDDLLMHSLLALSGAHLKTLSPGIEVYLATYRHYSIVIRTIRDCVPNHTTMDVPQALRMSLALMMLSFFEVIACTFIFTPTTGSLMECLGANWG